VEGERTRKPTIFLNHDAFLRCYVLELVTIEVECPNAP
jgi:hypothetical protein